MSAAEQVLAEEGGRLRRFAQVRVDRPGYFLNGRKAQVLTEPKRYSHNGLDIGELVELVHVPASAAEHRITFLLPPDWVRPL